MLTYAYVYKDNLWYARESAMNAITLLAAKSHEFRTFVAGGGLWGTLWRCVCEMAEDDNEYLRVAALGVIFMYI
jgi:hypothetical protein